jgi:hypothetical protein
MDSAIMSCTSCTSLFMYMSCMLMKSTGHSSWGITPFIASNLRRPARLCASPPKSMHVKRKTASGWSREEGRNSRRERLKGRGVRGLLLLCVLDEYPLPVDLRAHALDARLQRCKISHLNYDESALCWINTSVERELVHPTLVLPSRESKYVLR